MLYQLTCCLTEDCKMINPYMLTNFKTGLWTKDELQRLMSAVSVHGTNNWKFISLIVGTRNEKQCQNKWKNFDGGKSHQSAPWSPLEERHLFELIFSNAYILLERNSGLQLKKERKAIAKKIKEMKEYWENAYFNYRTTEMPITSIPSQIDMVNQLHNPADLQPINKRARQMNMETQMKMVNDDEIQIINIEEAYCQNQPIPDRCLVNKGNEESKIERSDRKRGKNAFILEWRWTDGRVEWTTTENLKLIQQYQVFKESWPEIGRYFWEKRVWDIRNHFYGMLRLTAAEYQLEMTLSLWNKSDEPDDRWILEYTDGVNDSLYVSDINNVSDQKLLWFLPILINIFKKVPNHIILKENQKKDSSQSTVEYRQLDWQTGPQNNSEEENTISYLRSLMMCPKQNFINEQKKLSFQIDLTEEDEQNTPNMQSKNDEEIILNINSWSNTSENQKLQIQNDWNQESIVQSNIPNWIDLNIWLQRDENNAENPHYQKAITDPEEQQNDKEAIFNPEESQLQSELKWAVNCQSVPILSPSSTSNIDLPSDNISPYTAQEEHSKVIQNTNGDEQSEISLIISKPSASVSEDQENLFSSLISYESMTAPFPRSRWEPPQISSEAVLRSLLTLKNPTKSSIEDSRPSKTQESMFKDFLFGLSPNLQSAWDKASVPNLLN